MIVGQGGSSKSRSETGVWGAQADYLRDLYGRASELSQQGNYEYGPNRVAGFDPASLEAFGAAEGRAGPGGVTALTSATEAETMKTLGGEYLDPDTNPNLKGIYETGAREIGRSYYGQINALGSRLEAAGRTGSGAQATGTAVAGQQLATGLGDFRAQLYGGAYNQERDRMGAAAGRAGTINEMGWRDISGLRAVGQQREEQAQRELDDFVARFQQLQYGSAEKLAEFQQMLGQPVMASKGRSSSINIGICHVAAEFFGWLTEEWFAARNFIIGWEGEGSAEFRRFYERNSVQLAAAIREDPELREEWRPVFEAFATLGAA